MRKRGNPGKHRRKSEGKDPGQPGESLTGDADGNGIQGNLEINPSTGQGRELGKPGDLTLANRREPDPGQLGRRPAGAGRLRKRGNPGNGSSAIPKDRQAGQLAGWPVGTADRGERWGNPQLESPAEAGDANEGQPEDASKALREA